jgi:hypothetical protein
MGMSTHVVGFKPPDEKWQRMKAAWDACKTAGVDVPEEIERYFEGEEPDPQGVEIDDDALTQCGALTPWTDDYAEGFQLEISKLPRDVRVIRFYNSW